MKRRLTPMFIFACAVVFVLLWIYGLLHSQYEGTSTDSVLKEVYNVTNVEMEPIRGRKNIIFLETLCAISPNEISNTGLILTKRQACAIESAAKWNPSSTIHLLYTCLMNGGIEKSSSYVKQLFKYPNVKIYRLDIPEFLKGTPLEGWDFHGQLSNSKWPVFHSSDVLRFVALYKYGGTYLDLDVVIKRSLEELGENYVGKESSDTLSSCALSMSAEVIGHEVAKLCVEGTLKDFNGDYWNHNGPDLITKVMKQVCGVDQVEKMSPETCRGFKVLSTDAFTPIFYYQWGMMFRSTNIQEVMDIINASYGVHMWNLLSSEGNVNLLIQQPYGLLALHHCPRVHSHSDINF